MQQGRLWGLALCLLGVLAFCKRETATVKGRNVSDARIVEIIPGKSIGEMAIGINVDTLPSRATVNRPGDTLDGIRFLISEADEVEDIWIEDLRAFPYELRLQGKPIARTARIEDENALWGRCERISGIKGGLFYNCAAGLAIGTDFSGRTLQIRVKPISAEAND